jgi:K+-sensing histidine kinase KdpD
MSSLSGPDRNAVGELPAPAGSSSGARGRLTIFLGMAAGVGKT